LIFYNLNRLTFPPVSKIKDVDELKSMMTQNMDTKFVGLFKGGADQEAQKIFSDFAHKYRSKALFLSADFPEAFKELGVQGSSGVVCLKSFDDKKVIMKLPLTTENLAKFVHVEALPMLGQIDDSNFTRYIDANLPIVFIFYVKEEDRGTITTEIKRIAEKYHGRFSFAFIDGFKYSGHAESLGLKADVYPGVGVQDFNSLKKYPLAEDQGEVKAGKLDTFLQSIIDGSASPYYVSGPVPAANDAPVKIVVHDNFKQLILDNDKDALVEMYTTWCHSCKRFGPLYEQLAEAFLKNQDKLVIGKMDLEANDQPSELNLKINTIPAVFLFPANKKHSPVRYQGDYSLSSLKEFVLENATQKLEVLPEEEAAETEQPVAGEEHDDL
jgi:protein disulfide-isomerase A1